MGLDRSATAGRSPHLVSLEREIERNNGKVTKVTRGRHYKVTALFPEGEIKFMVSATPRSSYCSAIQNKQLVRREIRRLRAKDNDD